jgi:hypothetical protein
MLTPRDRTVWCTRLATSCGLINIGRRTSALLGLLLSGKADIGKACRLTDHFQLACLNLSQGLKWRAPAGADYNGPIMLFLLLFGTPSNSRD